MKRFLTLLLIVSTTLFLACKPELPFDDDTNDDSTEQPTPTPNPDPEPENPTPDPEPEPTPDPEPAEVTATLTYNECKSSIGGYGKPNSYANSYGTWTICAYDNSNGIQINSGKVAYIGTPTFEGDIKRIALTFAENFSGDILLCSQAGTTAVAGQFESFSCGGKAQEYTLTTSGHKSLYIRSSACARITSITIVAGSNGSGGGTTPTPDPDPTPEPDPTPDPEPEPDPTPDPDPTPGEGVASQNWLELPAADNGKLYPNAVEVTVTSSGERNYTIYYDKSTYTSMWVAYPLESKHMGSNSRPKSWSYNPLIDTQYQVDLRSNSYEGGVYSRGHLIPNSSRNGIRDMQLQTFYVTNSVPQHQTRFNDGIWQQLESAMQSIAEREEIYIVTGVAFSKIGESKSVKYIQAKNDSKNIPIPNYFYKIALKVTTNSSGVVTAASTIGCWFENREYESGSSYSNYTVSVDQIEQWTGFNFFVNLPDSVENAAEKNSSWSSFQSF